MLKGCVLFILLMTLELLEELLQCTPPFVDITSFRFKRALKKACRFPMVIFLLLPNGNIPHSSVPLLLD